MKWEMSIHFKKYSCLKKYLTNKIGNKSSPKIFEKIKKINGGIIYEN